MLDYALRYAAAGFKVIPLRPRGKLPLTQHGAHDGTTDEAQIRAWFTQWPDANIGLTLGGFVVVDIDPRNGGTVEALPELSETCWAKTGGGGWHYLYRAEEGIRYAGKPAQGVDVKSGEGAYIVVEPSIHPSGEKYCWLDETDPWNTKPAVAPLFLGRQEYQAPIPGQIPIGSRNDSLTSMAGAMRRKGMSVEAMTAALIAENGRCAQPLDDFEVRRIAQSVGRYTPEVGGAEDEEVPSTVRVSQLKAEVDSVYDNGLGRGTPCGWPSVDALFSIAPGQLTTITGWPNSGKSQWLDSLMLNLARQGWRGVYCSLENIPIFLHAEKLAKQITGKPMRDGLTPRMTRAEKDAALALIDEWFTFVLPHEKKPNPSLADVVATIERDFKQRGLWGRDDVKRMCVIDPFNELEHVRPQGMTLTDHIGASLSMLRQWSRRNDLHVFLVGHPSKQQRLRDSGKLPIATPDMIADSAHFWNKSDNCITIALTDEHRSQEVDIHVQKIRFSHIGQRGVATLTYDKISGRYQESSPKWVGASIRVA